MTKPNIALLGLGLMGSSLGLGLKHHRLSHKIIGYASSRETRQKALEIGFVDEVAASAYEAVQDCDIVFLATPLSAMAPLLEEIKNGLKKGAILTDVGSVKGAVVKSLAPYVPRGVDFIPAHPIAGTEDSGPESGFASLFEGRYCILTPQDNANKKAIETISSLWRKLGCHVEVMSATHHDVALAMMSHLPHLVAYALAHSAMNFEGVRKSEMIKYSAGGFRDFTRIAASHPVMWRDVFLSNQESLFEVLDYFIRHLDILKQMIAKNDKASLEAFLSQTKSLRGEIVALGQDTKEVDWGRHLGKPLKK